METLFNTLIEQKRATDRDWRAAFLVHHAEHPRIYGLFKQFTFELISDGFENYSADAVMHRVRWETKATCQPKPGQRLNPDEPYKINNNYVAHYARMFMAEFPRYDGFFRTRSHK